MSEEDPPGHDINVVEEGREGGERQGEVECLSIMGEMTAQWGLV